VHGSDFWFSVLGPLTGDPFTDVATVSLGGVTVIRDGLPTALALKTVEGRLGGILKDKVLAGAATLVGFHGSGGGFECIVHGKGSFLVCTIIG